MKTLSAFITCLLAALFCGPAANAAVVMTLEQVGPDVVATASGTVDLTGLSFQDNLDEPSPYVYPYFGFLVVESNGGVYDIYNGVLGPTIFGRSYLYPTDAVTGSGDPLGIYGSAGQIGVPEGYLSGTPLSSTATWDTTLTALGVTPGVYTWTWGSGADADSLTLYAGVPEPAPALLLTLAAAAFATLKFAKTRCRPLNDN